MQYGAYADYALQHGLISRSQRNRIQGHYPRCKWGIDYCNDVRGDFACRSASAYCEATIFEAIMAIAGNVNVYDVRKPCIGPLCYDFSRMDEYLAQDSVRTPAHRPS